MSFLDSSLESKKGEERIKKCISKFKIITLCGSVKFEEEFWKAAHDLIKQECLVLMPKTFSNPDKKSISQEERLKFDLRHRQKIDISDAILVINKDGYIGEHTKSEIEYAKQKNKQIMYRYMYCKSDCAYRFDCFAKKRLIGFVPEFDNESCPECIYYYEEGL